MTRADWAAYALVAVMALIGVGILWVALWPAFHDPTGEEAAVERESAEPAGEGEGGEDDGEEDHREDTPPAH